ncbi:MAG TPA: thioredoxin-dependent thiol peroxidase [Gemmatimonadales bacterium]|jgi:peroxiredoxin Q/BCP|nr:thioredoxin-dependent thiol peroxidase [Gemmatimonadales bacterium]
MLEAGQKAPDFTVPADDGKVVSLAGLRGHTVVLFFYPKDDTPGCTTEACEIRDTWRDVQGTGALVYGVSPDSVKSHGKFRKKYRLPFPLLADADHRMAEAYGVWGPKQMFGLNFDGVHRTTFIIDGRGIIQRIFWKVKPEGHAAEILAALRT